MEGSSHWDTACIPARRFLALAFLAAGTLLHGNEADAQARNPPQLAYEPDPPVEMDVWLRRMVGRFSVEGMIQLGDECPRTGEKCETIKGTADCVSVGTGPGVQCMFNVTWQDLWLVDFEAGNVEPIAVSYLDPAMALFGLNPGKAAINHLLVNNKGLPEGGLGASTGSWAIFRTSCVNQPGIVGGCERIFRIEAKADARLLYMWIDVEMGPKDIAPPFSRIMLSLRRGAQDEGGEEPAQRR